MRATRGLRGAVTLSLVLGAIVLVACPDASGLDPDKQISQYGHSVWRTRDGIFDGTPFVLTQTADGYLWIGTNIGLVRFDGVSFSSWSPPPGERLLDTRIISLLATHDGSLWIGTGYGVARWSAGNLTNYPQLNGRIESMVEGADGTVWLVRTQATDGMGPLCAIKNEQTKCYGTADGIPFRLAIKVQKGSSGELWVGGYDELCRWTAGTCDSYFLRGRQHPETFASLRSMATAHDGSVWAAIDQPSAHFQLQHFEQGKWTPREFPEIKASNDEVAALFVDRDDVLWIGTAHRGLWRVRGDEIEHFGNTDGLSSDSVLGLYQDLEDNLWVITSEGVENFHDLRVTTFTTRQGLSDLGVSTVVASHDGTVWIANSRALDALRGKRIAAIRAGHGLPGQNVTTLFEDHAGRLWLGVDDGLWVYDNSRFRAVRRADGSNLGIVFSITEDNRHSIWARVGPNLDRIDDLTLTNETTSAQIATAYIIAANPRGGIILGLVNGDLLQHQDGKTQTLSAGGPDTHQVRDLFVESDGSVWGTTLDGVFRWKNGVRKNLTTRNGLPCDGVFAILKDEHDSLWVYSRCGLIAIEKGQLDQWWDNPDTLVKFALLDTADGVSPGLTPLKPQITRSPNGLLWFTGGRSLQMIDPRRLHLNSLPPPVHIEEIVADHKSYALQERLRLPPLTRDLEIRYAALSFVAPRKVQFRYRLEGRDENWQDPGARRQAFYSDLRPGHYTFRVIASNNEDVWNDIGATLEFTVPAAWFQTIWFRLACVAAFLLLLWAVYQFRVHQLQNEFAVSFEARVNERTRIARELHDTLLQSFQGVLMSFYMATDLLPGLPDEAKKRLQHVIDRAAQAITEGRDAVQGLRSSTEEKNDLAAAVRALGEQLVAQETGQNPPVLQLNVEGSPRDLHPILRDEVYRITGEALRNAFRHAQASRIQVEIHYDDRKLAVRVRDNGKGMAPGLANKDGGRAGHYGLHGMRERSKLIGGDFELWSELGSGTLLTLTIPAKVAYASAPPHRRLWFSRRERPGAA